MSRRKVYVPSTPEEAADERTMQAGTEAIVSDLLGHLQAEGLSGTAFVLSAGAPCSCGPDFCCQEDADGGYGACRGRKAPVEGAPGVPACPHCGAAHQGFSRGRVVCWRCCEHPVRPYRTNKGTGPCCEKGRYPGGTPCQRRDGLAYSPYWHSLRCPDHLQRDEG